MIVKYVRAQPALKMIEPATMEACRKRRNSKYNYSTLIIDYLLTDGSDEKSRERHNAALSHAPGGLDHHEVRIFEAGRPVLPHVGGHVGGHVPKGVEGPHGELKEETAKHSGKSS